MEMHKSKSLNFLAPSLRVSDVDYTEPLNVPDDDNNDDDNDSGAKTDMSIKSAIEVNVPQERRLSGSQLGANLNMSMGHLNLNNTKQYILGTTRVNVRTSSGPTVRPMKPTKDAGYNTDKVLEGARSALELMEAMNKCREHDDESQNNMGMFYRRTTVATGDKKVGGIVGSLVQRFEKTKTSGTDSNKSEDVETPIFV